MSRHSLPGHSPGLTIVVGWDQPLTTFFAQVTREDAAGDDVNDPVVLWLGGSPNEIEQPEDMSGPLAPYAILTEDVIASLNADRAANAGRGPTALQREMLARFGRMP